MDMTSDLSLQESCMAALHHMGVEVRALIGKTNELETENAKLRECLQDFADAIKNDDGFGVDQGWMLERMRELGVNEE